MTNENLMISCEELLELSHEYPLEIRVILDMLSEAGEGCHMEKNQLEETMKVAA